LNSEPWHITQRQQVRAAKSVRAKREAGPRVRANPQCTVEWGGKRVGLRLRRRERKHRECAAEEQKTEKRKSEVI